jgi:S-adenosyl-l-methionine hydroxide adenosyltransferase
MKAVLHQMAPGVPAIDLFADAPAGNPRASAYLLVVYATWFPVGTIFLCVVDPGVGGRARPLCSRPMADGTLAPATACLSWSSAVPQRHAAGTSTGGLSGSQPAFMGATSSHPSQPRWRAASRHPASSEGMTRSPRRLARRPLRDRLRRPLRQCHDRVESGRATAQRQACLGGSDIGARENLQRSAARLGLLVRELERARRNRRQPGTC